MDGIQKKELSWTKLMGQAQAGNQKSYRVLLQELAVASRNYIRKRIEDEDEVENIVQEVLISIDRARHTFLTDRPFNPWFYAIVRYRLNDYLRRLYRLNQNEINEFNFEFYSYFDNHPNQVENSELMEQIMRSIEKLPEVQGKIIKLHHLDGIPYKQIAQALDMNESAVKVSAHRGYKKLRVELHGVYNENR